MTPSTTETAITAAVHQAMQKTLPQYYTVELADEIAADTIAELEELHPGTTHSGEPTASIRAEAEQILAQCCQRRPDRDPATGNLLSGVEDTDETFRDRLLCVERHGHDSDHRDAMRRTWPRQGVTA
ncbi:hypothetical protein [Streptomyces sp. NBC_01518]|uniref:hypothetical protein n=1 Tax=Streptomyces sp. NBC_01518 TaxID=2903891 RepID=UPI00386DFCA3